jgi:hypothetical protein
MGSAVRKRALIGLGFVAVLGCMQAGPGIAGMRESTFYVSPDGSTVAFDVHGVSRRDVLDQLLQNQSIEPEWVDAAFADELISGTFKGSTDAVLQRLLAQANFVAVYAPDGDGLARLIIVGRSTPQTNPTGLARDTPPPGNATDTPLAMPPPPADGQAAAMTPPAPGSEAPALVPPTSSDRASPLMVPAQGMVVPLMVPPSPSEATLPLVPSLRAPAK